MAGSDSIVSANKFKDSIAELKWVFEISGSRERDFKIGSGIINPAGDAHWTGLRFREDTPPTVAKGEFEIDWNVDSSKYLQRQERFARLQTQAKKSRFKKSKAEIIAATHKRDPQDQKSEGSKDEPIDSDSSEIVETEHKITRSDRLRQAAHEWKQDRDVHDAELASKLRGKPKSLRIEIRTQHIKHIKKQLEARILRIHGENKLRQKNGRPLASIPYGGFGETEIKEYIDLTMNEGKRRVEAIEQVSSNKKRPRDNDDLLVTDRVERAATYKKRDLADAQRRRVEHMKKKAAEDTQARLEKRNETLETSMKRFLESRAKSTDGSRTSLSNDIPPKPWTVRKTQRSIIEVKVGSKEWLQLSSTQRIKILKIKKWSEYKIAVQMSKDDIENAKFSNKRKRDSFAYQERFENHKAAIKTRAEISGQTPGQFAIAHGFKSVDDCVRAELKLLESDLALESGAGTTEEKLPMHEHVHSQIRKGLAHALEENLKVCARRDETTISELLRKQGFQSIRAYLRDNLAALLKDREMPHDLEPVPRLSKFATENERERDRQLKDQNKKQSDRNKVLWKELCMLVFRTREWEMAIEEMPDPKMPPPPNVQTQNQGMATIYGLEF